MTIKDIFKISISLLLSLGATSCSVTKRLSGGEYLLSSNKFNITYADSVNKKDKLDKGDVRDHIPITQKPNSKILWYNLPLKIYDLSNPESSSWGNKVLRKIGQPAVLFDSLDNINALEQLKLYFNSEGYYDAKVTDTVTYNNKRASVMYNIDAGAPYYISSYKYNFIDSTVMPYVLTNSSKSLIKKNDILKRSLLENERTRIANILADDGFYFFFVGSVDYLIDTTKNAADVTININKRVIDRVPVDYKRYIVNNITVSNSNRSLIYLRTKDPKIEKVKYDSITFLYPEIIKSVSPKVVSKLITMSQGDILTKSIINETKNNLSTIPLFGSVDLAFTELDSTVNLFDDNFGLMDCSISLLQEMKQGFNVDAEITTNDNFSGFSLTLGYVNNNIFKGGEVLNISVTGGYDLVNNISENDKKITDIDRKNSWEIGGSISIVFPRLLAPLKFERFRSLNNISTQIEAVINSQKRPAYDRTITSLSYGYLWDNGNNFSYMLNPIAVSLINVPRLETYFIENSIGDNAYLRNSYDSQVIAGSNFSVLYRRNINNSSNHSVKLNFESSGNLLYLGSKAFKAKENIVLNKEGEFVEDYYDIFDIRYAQYLRGDLSYTYEIEVTKGLSLAYRMYGGLGYSYGNSKTLPFDRMFYAGGGSSMRGWQLRSLGPGNYAPKVVDGLSNYANQLGNIRLETNLEARFPLYKILHGAIFFDLGNIWSNVNGRKNEEEEIVDKSSRFAFNTFYKQLGFNTGLGIRLDIEYFVIRMDWGIQLHNPSSIKGDRWVKKFSFNKTALHFAIGYPF